MHKIFKVKPSVPNRDWVQYGVFDDNCYGCKERTSCNSCSRAKIINEEQNRKAIKQSRKQIREMEVL